MDVHLPKLTGIPILPLQACDSCELHPDYYEGLRMTLLLFLMSCGCTLHYIVTHRLLIAKTNHIYISDFVILKNLCIQFSVYGYNVC